MFHKNISKVIKNVLPAVVTIVVSKSLREVEKELPAEMFPLIPFGMPNLKSLKDKDARGMVQIDGGSGFIVDSNGIILTNRHVVSDPEAEYTVVTSDGKKYTAEIIGKDPVKDIAILKIPTKSMPIVRLGDSSKLDLGQTVYAIGTALGLFPNSVSRGIISGMARSITAQPEVENPIQEFRGLIQTDAAINPGNSGGPLINKDGEVVAINVAKVSEAQSVSFSIPINAAKHDLEDIKKYGCLQKPFLGVLYLTINKNLKEKMSLAFDYGALVAGKNDPLEGIIPGSPAEKAGIKEGDIILECNGEKITSEKTIQDFLDDLCPGDIMVLKIIRNGKELGIKAVLGVKK